MANFSLPPGENGEIGRGKDVVAAQLGLAQISIDRGLPAKAPIRGRLPGPAAFLHPNYAQSTVRRRGISGESLQTVLIHGEITARASGAGETLGTLCTLGALGAGITFEALNALLALFAEDASVAL